MHGKEQIRKAIRRNYSKVAKGTAGGCCGGSCCCGGAPVDSADIAKKIGYSASDVTDSPADANMGLGCGNPLAIAELKDGETVLDLGSGGGFDCFLASRKVGGNGHVIGIDMTPDMIDLARKNAAKNGYGNVEFRLGDIEHLPVDDASVDVIISNCVVNLALDKQRVFREAFRVLKPCGRLSISDVVATKSLPDSIRKDLSMISGCIGGAAYVEELKSMLTSAGFHEIALRPKQNSSEIIKSWGFGGNIEDYVASYEIKAVK